MVLINNIKRFWRQWHNKFLSLLFISISLLFYIGYYLAMEFMYDFTLFASYPSELWNLFVYGLVYLIIFFGNIRNNNVAYSGILMFVCMLVLDSILTFLEILPTGIWAVSPLSLLSLFFQLASIVIGIFYYRNVFLYINGRKDDFKAVRIFGIVFSCLVCINVLPTLLLFIIDMDALHFLVIISILGLTISEAFCSLSCVFTVERIKRE